MASKNSELEKDKIWDGAVTEMIDLVSSEESDEDVKCLGSSVSRANSKRTVPITPLNGKKQKQSCAYRSNREIDRTNSVLVSSKRPVVIKNLNVGLSSMTKKNKEHSINTKISKAKNVEIIHCDPVSPNTPFSESDKNISTLPNVDKTELKRILETVNNLHSDNALHDCEKSYQDKLFFPTAGQDSDQSAKSSIPIINFTLETKIENFDSSDVATNVSPLPLNNVTIKTDKENFYPVDVSTKVSILALNDTIKTDKENFYPVDVPTKVSILALNDTIKTEKENCGSSDVPRNLPALRINNGTIDMEREIFESDNVSMNASPLTSNASDSLCLTKLEMQQMLKRIDETSKKSFADKNADRKNANNKNKTENFQNLIGPEVAIRNSSTKEKPTGIKLEVETKSYGLLCNSVDVVREQERRARLQLLDDIREPSPQPIFDKPVKFEFNDDISRRLKKVLGDHTQKVNSHVRGFRGGVEYDNSDEEEEMRSSSISSSKPGSVTAHRVRSEYKVSRDEQFSYQGECKVVHNATSTAANNYVAPSYFYMQPYMYGATTIYYQAPSFMYMQPCMYGATTTVVPPVVVPPTVIGLPPTLHPSQINFLQ